MISQWYDLTLDEKKVKELSKKVLWRKNEIKFRIDINLDFYVYQAGKLFADADKLPPSNKEDDGRLGTAGSARSAASALVDFAVAVGSPLSLISLCDKRERDIGTGDTRELKRESGKSVIGTKKQQREEDGNDDDKSEYIIIFVCYSKV